MIRNYNMTKDAKIKTVIGQESDKSAAQTKYDLYDATRDLVIDAIDIIITEGSADSDVTINLGTANTATHFAAVSATVTDCATAGVVLSATLSNAVLPKGEVLLDAHVTATGAGQWVPVYHYYAKDDDRMAGGPRYEG